MPPESKVLKKLMERTKETPSTVLDALIENYVRNERFKHIPKPEGKKNYVGIEVECYSLVSRNEIMKMILEQDLESYIDMHDDGSIQPPYIPQNNLFLTQPRYHTYELRILVRENELEQLFKKLKVFFKQGKFKTNSSCGLHVHLDMRHRDVDACYKKLIKFQHIMFGLVNNNRWNSEYCQWANEDKTKEERFSAVNFESYDKHKTLEIRLHHGTTDVKKIENWVNLLLKAVNSKPIGEIKSKSDVLKFAGRNKQMKTYLKTFKNQWFKRREKVMKGFEEEDEYVGYF